MNIVVCIKQVPDVDDIKWTKENNLDRSQMLSKINLYDDWALNCAIKIKTQFKNVNLTAVSMGPMQALEVLQYALAKGATRAILLSDKFFSASDTLITADVLARAIKKFVPDFDIIITGQMAQDGDTAQVPVSLAQKLDIVDLIYTQKIINADKNTVSVNQKIENKINVLETKTPCLIAINDKQEGYTPKIEDYIRAQNKQIEIYGAEDLNLSKEQTGLIASPTMVYRAYRPKSEREAELINENIVDKLSEFLKG